MSHKSDPPGTTDGGVRRDSPEKGELSRLKRILHDAPVFTQERDEMRQRLAERIKCLENTCACPTEPEGGCPHCGHAGPKQTTQEHRDRCHRASVGR